MSGKEQSGKEKGTQAPANESARPAEQWAERRPRDLAYGAWQRAATRVDLLTTDDVLALQRMAGNQAVHQLLAERTQRDCCDDEVTAEATPTAEVVQLHGESRNLPVPATPFGMSSEPAEQVSALPAEVQQAHQAWVAAGDLRGALDVVVQHMASAGQIDAALLRTQVNPDHNRSICQGDDCFALEDVRGAFTMPCNPIPEGDVNLPNPRIKINPSIIRRLNTLHSTLLHEYRHVLQEYALANHEGGEAVGRQSDCLDCNDPYEVDARLAEIEQGYDSEQMLNAFARVYVSWDYLAPEQRTAFQARRDAAEAKVTGGDTGLDWSNSMPVVEYRHFAEQLIAEHEARTRLRRPFFCNRLMAPVNPERRSGQAPERASAEAAEGQGQD